MSIEAKTYNALLKKLRELDNRGLFDSEEADDVRCVMEQEWVKMTPNEQAELSSLAALERLEHREPNGRD